MTQTFVRKHFQITLPAEIREKIPVEVGDPVEIHLSKKGNITIELLKTIDAAQSWFWTKKHQQAEKEAEQEMNAGKGKKAKTAESLIDELNK